MKRRKFIQISSKSALALSALSFGNGFPFILPESTSAGKNAIHLADMKGWEIIVSEDSIESEKYAATEFQRIFKSVTGDELKIPVGGEEGFHIHVSKDLMIAGAQPRGVLYGVYEFFERYAGVRFLTRDHT